MKYHFNDDAEGEVLGVILMVAICVILAAIVAVLVFGMMEAPEQSKPVGVTVTRTTANIEFIYVGGPFTDEVKEVRCYMNGTGGSSAYVLLVPEVGYKNTTTQANGDPAGTTDISVLCEYKDGSIQLIQEKTV
jgi:FlaG/FlaF family flagellin (archaellin)